MKDSIEVLVFENHVIKLFDGADYKFDSMDNVKTYSKVFASGDKSVLTSRIGVEVFEGDELVSSCIIGSEGGRTGVAGNTNLISYGGLVVCCSNTVFKMAIPSLDLEWKTISDSVTCFGIYSFGKGYVVHGELEITSLDRDGKIVWKQSGRDIWATAEAIDDFTVYDDYILATDWEYNRYKFDVNGKLLEEYKVEPRKEELSVGIENAKKWWKFW